MTLLLPPGVEPHSFEPRPKDILRINQADVFVYTGSFMEPWAASIIKGVDTGKLVVVDASEGAVLHPETEDGPLHGGEAGHDRNGSGEHEESIDPHIWLDLGNAQKMVDNICAGFVQKDPDNKAFLREERGGVQGQAGRARQAVRGRPGAMQDAALCPWRPLRLQLPCAAVQPDLRVGLRLFS